LIYQTVLAQVPIPEGRLFGLDQQTLLQFALNLVNVILLAVILSKLLYNPVRNLLHKRAEKIRGQFEQAANEIAKGNELKREYEQKLLDIRREQDGILENARRIAAETERESLAEAKREAESIKARARAEIEMERERVREDMKAAIIDVSKAIAEMYLKREIDKDDHDRFFTEAMSELEDAVWRN